MSGIIVPTGPSVHPVFTGYAPSGRLTAGLGGQRRPGIDPSHRILREMGPTAPAMHAPRGSLVTAPSAATAVAATAVTGPASHAAARNRWAVRAWVVGGAIGFVLMALQLGLGAAGGGRFLPGVSVAGQQLGGLTRPQAQHLLATRASHTRIRFQAGGITYNVTPASAGASYNAATTLDQAYAVGHPAHFEFMPLALWQASHTRPLPVAYSFNPPTQQAFLHRIVAASGQAPVNAAVVVTNGVPAVQPDVSGHDLSPKAVSAAIATQLSYPGTAPPQLQPTTQAARIRTANLAPALAKTRQLIATPVTITYQGQSFTPTPAQEGAWISFTPTAANQAPGLIPKLDPDAIAAYLATIAGKINVSPVAQKVNVQNGVASVFQQGQNGTALNSVALATAIAGLTPGQPFTTAAPTTPVPFPTQYNNSVALPYDQYIEVNLTTQHLWVYQNHSVIYDSPVTSGATGAGFPTATGMFSILTKQTDRHLVGYQYGPAYNYDVFVQYWMQFYEGFGLHDASWRNGNFGGQDYYYGGSHGCVNLPLATAAWLYNWSSVGTPVWVHT